MTLQIITIFTAIIFFTSLMAFNNRDLFNKYLFSPYLVTKRNEWYRMLTAGFLHGGWVHLLINLFVLWQFGVILEDYFIAIFGKGGSMAFMTLLFLGGIVFANIPALLQERTNYNYRSLGASGGVSAVLFSFILLDPWSLLYLYFILPIPSVIAGLLFLYYSWWASKNRNDNIDHMAHFAGSVYGLIITIIFYPTSLAIFGTKTADFAARAMDWISQLF